MSSYEQDEAAWRAAWKDVALVHAPFADWATPWVDESHRDGNPIFSAVSQSARRGVRILRHDRPDVMHWLDFFAKGEPEEIRELVVSVPEGVEVSASFEIRSLLENWIRDGRAVQEKPLDDMPSIAA
jgi:hypothetical protein